MDANPVLKAIAERRSVRKFTAEAVTDQELLAVLEAGRWAPSGLNNQPWRFLVLKPGDPRQNRLAGCTKYGHIVRAARALIAVVLKKKEMYSEIKDRQAAGAAVQNMLLAIHSLGLGGVWLGEIIDHQDLALDELGLDPAEYELEAVIALGRPAQKGSSRRRELSELILEAL
ncbi:MAG: nitroreductase [Desulfovibrionaceae bacterium]|nr:nitroreductase [Desulfovibrionaceae bacterium]MDD4951577.1 nitroreductase [Desulfovibrionaceae bacterium]